MTDGEQSSQRTELDAVHGGISHLALLGGQTQGSELATSTPEQELGPFCQPGAASMATEH